MTSNALIPAVSGSALRNGGESRSRVVASLAPTRGVRSLPGLTVLPRTMSAAGHAACYAWDEFFAAHIRNPHTRAAYLHAVRRFFHWLEGKHEHTALAEISPALVGIYFDQHPGSAPTRKLHLAALRRLFDLLVTRHLMVLNPAACVRGERYQVIEGKTPEITLDQVKRLIASIGTGDRVRLRDRAVVGVMLFTAARAGAIARLRFKHFRHDGSQWTLRFDEKGGKSREIPVRHDLERFLLDYIEAAGLTDAPGDSPLFRSAYGKTGRLTGNGVTGVDLCRMVKRRLKEANLPSRLSPHSFRVFTVTDLLTQGVPLEAVQYLAGHSDPRTTRLYDRRPQRVTRNIVERISVQFDEQTPR
jgi:integrase/recombinase XerD